MRIIQAPNPYIIEDGEFSIFLAGSAGNHDWRTELLTPLLEKHKDMPIVFLNPYRLDYPKKVSELQEQNQWECDSLQKTNGVIFWLCDETLAPLSLLELGLFLEGARPMFFGMNPNYKISFEIKDRIRIFKPTVSVAASIPELQKEVSRYFNTFFSNVKKASRIRLSQRRMRLTK